MNNINTSITHITSENDNIFEDLGFSPLEATKLKIKAQLMCKINDWLHKTELRQDEASDLLQITKSKLSDVIRGNTRKFTIDALVDILEKTGQHITIQIS
ncbi:MAG: XRE family transcriptional regulator [Thiomargarita sp.]|nr:XRE family transcriptional regulator [Thiomargarita sp.]